MLGRIPAVSWGLEPGSWTPGPRPSLTHSSRDSSCLHRLPLGPASAWALAVSPFTCPSWQTEHWVLSVLRPEGPSLCPCPTVVSKENLRNHRESVSNLPFVPDIPALLAGLGAAGTKRVPGQ